MPVTPVDRGRPVAFVRVPEVGVPRMGVTSVGLVAKTSAPVPVSSVTAAMRFALDGVARNVATPAAKPDTPVETGNPVQLVKVPVRGVPNVGAVNVLLPDEYHCVVELALKYMTPATGIVTAALAASASIVPPTAGNTAIGLAPLLTTTKRRPTVAVGSVTPDGLADAVVMML